MDRVAPMKADAVVLGGGPAGLGAALALVRGGARVTLVDAGPRVGGVSVTVRRGDYAFDLGGHILFVNDGGREAWLRELLGSDLRWIDRPVTSVLDGDVVPGRYLDRRADGIGPPPAVPASDTSAATMLGELFGVDVVERHMRRYLEKVDGMSLEAITATRARKLLVEQYAPEGFWFASGGVGRLMDAMARAIRAGGGTILTGTRVEAIATGGAGVESVAVVDSGGGSRAIDTTTVIGAIPPALAARLVTPPMPADVGVALPPRAAIVVALAVDVDSVTDQAWIQVDRDDVPFARIAEMGNWSPNMNPTGSTVLVCEVYCHPHDSDPWWALDDARLAVACAAALVSPLGLVDADRTISTVDVIRLPRAWSLVAVDSAARAAAPARWLDGIAGFITAQGGDVVSAIAAGEHAAALAAGSRRT